MKCPKATVFDVDDTLAESFRPPSHQMMSKLELLLAHVPIAIVSAAGFPRIERDFLHTLSRSPHASNLYVLPNSSAQAYTWNDGWTEEYSLALSPTERNIIRDAILECAERPDPRAIIIDREVQVAYATIGLDASLEEKKAWDPDQSKRKELKTFLDKRLPGYEVLIGGMTTIDITRKGVSKAYGVRWLAERLKCEPSDMFYVGDALYPGGNDAVVIPTGIQTRSVTGPSETESIIDELIAACSA
jgi:hypothetical protein